jgi:hypothetical protein
MPKPTTKEQVIEAAKKERAALEELLATLTLEQMTNPNVIGEWAVKDVLSHLVEWEGMVMNWYAEGKKGKIPAVPSKEYNWGQLPQLNQAIFLRHRDKPLAEIMKTFKSSYKKIMKTTEDIPEKELFTRKVYKWANNNPLAAYFVSATSSHYRWARTTIRSAIKK